MAPYVCDKWAVTMYKRAGDSATGRSHTLQGWPRTGNGGGGAGLLNNRVLSCHE